MKLGYDPAKNQRNIVDRGLSFERAIDLDWPDAVIRVDARKTYPEIRLLAIGYLDNRLHILYQPVDGRHTHNQFPKS